MYHPDFQPLEYDYRSKRPIWTLFHLLNRRWYHHAAMILLLIAKHSPVWCMPFLMQRVIDTFAEENKYPVDTLPVAFIVFVLIIAQNIPTHMAYVRMLSGAVRDLERTLRNALVTRLQQLSIAFHDRTETGRLQAKVLRDVEQIQNFCMLAGEGGMIAVLSFLVATIVAGIKEPRVLVFFIVMGPLVALVRNSFRRHIDERNTAFRSQIEKMSSGVTEMLNMVPVVRAHGLEGVATRRMKRKLDEVTEQGRRLDMINALFGSTSFVVFQESVIVGIAVLSWFCYKGLISVGDIALYQGMFSTLTMAVSGILGIYPQLAKGVESIRSLGEILECPDLEYNWNKARIEKLDGAVELRQVSFQYEEGTSRALTDISLKVEPGESIALVGPSGGGKSTLMQLLIGFRRPQEGSILLDGRDIEEIDMRTARRFMSVVPQETLLFSGSIRDNVLYGLDGISDDRLARVLAAANLTEFVASLPDGVDTLIGEDGSMLSGGQRQRIAIARALIRNPRILVLDEATSALDVDSEKKVQEAINRAVQNRTTFIVAHRLSTIRNADRIVVLRGGRIVETGGWEELMEKKGYFYEMQQLQQR